MRRGIFCATICTALAVSLVSQAEEAPATNELSGKILSCSFKSKAQQDTPQPSSATHTFSGKWQISTPLPAIDPPTIVLFALTEDDKGQRFTALNVGCSLLDGKGKEIPLNEGPLDARKLARNMAFTASVNGNIKLVAYRVELRAPPPKVAAEQVGRNPVVLAAYDWTLPKRKKVAPILTDWYK